LAAVVENFEVARLNILNVLLDEAMVVGRFNGLSSFTKLVTALSIFV